MIPRHFYLSWLFMKTEWKKVLQVILQLHKWYNEIEAWKFLLLLCGINRTTKEINSIPEIILR
jgi:hypothetical protein